MKSFTIERRSELILGLSNIIENAAEFAKENVIIKISKVDDMIQMKLLIGWVILMLPQEKGMIHLIMV